MSCRNRAGKDQHVRLFPIVRDDSLLDGVLQALDDRPPRFGRGLAPELPIPIRQPAAQEVLLLQAEVVHGEPQRFGHGIEPLPRELHHDVDLPYLPFVVQPERFEVGVGEAAPRFFVPEPDGHGGAKHREALVEADDFLFVQPEQGAVQELLRILDPARSAPGRW